MSEKTRLVSQKELAYLLNISTRWVRELEGAEVLPVKRLGARKFYPWPEANHRFIEYQVSLKEANSKSEAELRARKLAAETELQELKLAERRGELIPAGLHLERVGLILDRLRSRLLAAPGYWAPQVVGLKDVGEGTARLRKLTHELLEQLSALGDTWADETDDTPPEVG